MPSTIAAAFTKFRQKIELAGDHRELAFARRDEVVEMLGKKLSILESLISGSIPRHTALAKDAHLDLFVALHFGKHIKGRNPSDVLMQVRDALSDYKVGSRTNAQAVVLRYDTWPDVDIIPVFRSVAGAGNVIHYNLPDPYTEKWLRSAPKKHSRDLALRNQACGVGFKRIIKMAKWWNKQNSSLLESYHIEVMALHIYENRLTDYSWDMFQFFDRAAALIQAPLWHEGSFVDTYLTPVARKESGKMLEQARDKAWDAWYATFGENNDHAAAIKKWRQIFGDPFPTYSE
jgi:hypothetical protein